MRSTVSRGSTNPQKEEASPAMLGSSGDVNEAKRCEIEVFLEEYKICYGRILRELEDDNKGFEFIVIALSATVVALSFAVQERLYFTLLVLAIPFHLLSMLHARRIFYMAFLENHMREVIAPKINRIILDYKNISQKEQIEFLPYTVVLTKEIEANPFYLLENAMPHIARSIVQLTIAIFLVSGYFYFNALNPEDIPQVVSVILLIINLLFFVTSIYLLILSSLYRVKKTMVKTSG